jgi:hypothetical protein
MRTKTLLITAAIGVATAAGLNAQVYSVNAVGYINLDLKTGFNLVANQLDNGNGNNVSDILAGLTDGTVYKFLPDGSFDISSLLFGSWSKPDLTLEPGVGFWVKVGSDVTVTLVGEVPQGQLTNPLKAGFNLVSSMVPQAGLLQTDLGYPAGADDTIYQWSVANGEYIISSILFGGWQPSEPTIGVGEGFWAKIGADADWSRNFSVNN